MPRDRQQALRLLGTMADSQGAKRNTSTPLKEDKVLAKF